MIDLELAQQDYEELEGVRQDLTMLRRSFEEEPLNYTEADSITSLLNNTIHVIQVKQQNIENYIHENKNR